MVVRGHLLADDDLNKIVAANTGENQADAIVVHFDLIGEL